MKRKNILNSSPIKTAVGVAGFGLATGLGAKVVSSAGGDASGVAALAGFAPALGAIGGAKVTLDMLNDLPYPLNSRRKR